MHRTISNILKENFPEVTRGFSVNDFFQKLIIWSLALNLGLSIGVIVVEEARLGGGLSDARENRQTN
jgi:hypothetical protein